MNQLIKNFIERRTYQSKLKLYTEIRMYIKYKINKYIKNRLENRYIDVENSGDSRLNIFLKDEFLPIDVDVYRFGYVKYEVLTTGPVQNSVLKITTYCTEYGEETLEVPLNLDEFISTLNLGNIFLFTYTYKNTFKIDKMLKGIVFPFIGKLKKSMDNDLDRLTNADVIL